MKNREYFDSVLRDLAALRDGNKQLVIVSSGKDTLAYETAALLADSWKDAGIGARFVMLRCEDGMMHEHVLVGENIGGTIDRAVKLLDERESGLISRPQLQFELGKLLVQTKQTGGDFLFTLYPLRSVFLPTRNEW